MSHFKQAAQDYENMLLDATQYSGARDALADKKVFSASMLGSPLLQNYLRIKYGTKKNKYIGMNTLGSLYQLGIDVAAEKWNSRIRQEAPHDQILPMQYNSAMRLAHKLDNGWIISGEIDQYDLKNNVIWDNKLTTETTYKSIVKEGKYHHYALQLGVYKWLMMKNGIAKEEPICGIPLANKSFSHYKTNKAGIIEFVEINTFSPDEIEQMLYDKTKELDMYFDMDQIPERPPMNQLMPYKRKGQARAIPMRCEHYCDYKQECPYYTSHDAISSFVNSLI